MDVRPREAARVFSMLRVSAREGAGLRRRRPGCRRRLPLRRPGGLGLLRRRLRILLGPWCHLLLRLARGLRGLLRRRARLCGALRLWFRLGLRCGSFLLWLSLLRGLVLLRRGSLQSLRCFRRRVIAFHIFGWDPLRYARNAAGKQLLALARQFLLFIEAKHVELVRIEIRATGKRGYGQRKRYKQYDSRTCTHAFSSFRPP